MRIEHELKSLDPWVLTPSCVTLGRTSFLYASVCLSLSGGRARAHPGVVPWSGARVVLPDDCVLGLFFPFKFGLSFPLDDLRSELVLWEGGEVKPGSGRKLVYIRSQR